MRLTKGEGKKRVQRKRGVQGGIKKSPFRWVGGGDQRWQNGRGGPEGGGGGKQGKTEGDFAMRANSSNVRPIGGPKGKRGDGGGGRKCFTKDCRKKRKTNLLFCGYGESKERQE